MNDDMDGQLEGTTIARVQSIWQPSSEAPSLYPSLAVLQCHRALARSIDVQ